MSRSIAIQKGFCLALGVGVAVCSIGLMARTAAISAPDGFFAWFKANGSIDTGLFLWDTAVTYGLGIGLPAFLALLVAFRFIVAATAGAAIHFILGALFTIHVLVPLWSSGSFGPVFARHWWNYSLEVSLVLASLAALFVARRFWPHTPAPTGTVQAG